ncbi:MAG TPA: methyltransferase domain-containing protein [Anaerolineales bacterium]|nr:methyltransferase domain-containing protein [Anaerolineales bacterium]
MGTKDAPKDVWASGNSYEPYVGRWSRLVAQEFLRWLAFPEDRRWLDVGCGTGALSQTILNLAHPQKVKGIDRSEGFVEFARAKTDHPLAEFEVGDAQALPVESETYDAAISGLVLNFVPQPEQMIAEMRRAVCAGGTVALYVWDYAGKMQLMRHFWNAASALDPSARALDEGRRFPICSPNALIELFQGAGLAEVRTYPIDVPTDFKDFDDYWTPFLGGQGPAPSYTMSLSEDRRAQLRERLYNSLPFALDGSIPLVARAWAVRGVK